MKIQVISDLHQEFGMSELGFKHADLIIFAGDINTGIKGIKWMKKNFESIPVIYVLGNHEYYKGAYPKVLHQIKEESVGTNIMVLENEQVEIDGICFHGATLWTDFSIFGNPIEYGMICQGKMSDYKLIRRAPSYSKLRTIDTFNIHQKTVGWLEESLQKARSKRNIVITHHAPSIKSVPDEYLKDPITSAYASNLDELILKFQPNYWIHGHIHTPIRYKIGQTEVICNPHGYIDEPYNGYEKDLIIEI